MTRPLSPDEDSIVVSLRLTRTFYDKFKTIADSRKCKTAVSAVIREFLEEAIAARENNQSLEREIESLRK